VPEVAATNAPDDAFMIPDVTVVEKVNDGVVVGFVTFAVMPFADTTFTLVMVPAPFVFIVVRNDPAVSTRFVCAVAARTIAVSVKATVVASPAVDGKEPLIAIAVSTKLVCAVLALAIAVSVNATVVANPAIEGIAARMAMAVSVSATVVANPAIDGITARIAVAVSFRLVWAYVRNAAAVSVNATVVANPAVLEEDARIAAAVSTNAVCVAKVAFCVLMLPAVSVRATLVAYKPKLSVNDK